VQTSEDNLKFDRKHESTFLKPSFAANRYLIADLQELLFFQFDLLLGETIAPFQVAVHVYGQRIFQRVRSGFGYATRIEFLVTILKV